MIILLRFRSPHQAIRAQSVVAMVKSLIAETGEAFEMGFQEDFVGVVLLEDDGKTVVEERDIL